MKLSLAIIIFVISFVLMQIICLCTVHGINSYGSVMSYLCWKEPKTIKLRKIKEKGPNTKFRNIDKLELVKIIYDLFKMIFLVVQSVFLAELLLWYFTGNILGIEVSCGRHADDMQMTCGWHADDLRMTQEWDFGWDFTGRWHMSSWHHPQAWHQV